MPPHRVNSPRWEPEMHLLPSGVHVRHVTEALACDNNRAESHGCDVSCLATLHVGMTKLSPYPAEAGMRSAYVEVHCWLVRISHRWKHLRSGLSVSPRHWTELHAIGFRSLPAWHLQCAGRCRLYACRVCRRALLRLRCEQMNIGASRIDRSPAVARALRNCLVSSAGDTLRRAPEQTSEPASAWPARPPS